ncbi:hypothetical protein AB0H88_11535 [Nonomuraea sp. NPDC050680]|uniref:hypothetical protein n=1 Tax=Nonomuraea sp. NPDC050680 TaxID=3154630 RepID=UPI0033F833AA
MPVNAPLRVVQWATGAVGRYALRSVLSRPGLELAAVLVYDRDKIGKDAGELVSLPYAGVSCTDDPERVMAIEADCVLHTPLPSFYFGYGLAAAAAHAINAIPAVCAAPPGVRTLLDLPLPTARARVRIR